MYSGSKRATIVTQSTNKINELAVLPLIPTSVFFQMNANKVKNKTFACILEGLSGFGKPTIILLSLFTIDYDILVPSI